MPIFCCPGPQVAEAVAKAAATALAQATCACASSTAAASAESIKRNLAVAAVTGGLVTLSLGSKVQSPAAVHALGALLCRGLRCSWLFMQVLNPC